MSAPSSHKKIKEMFVDRLSALPDGILCYILSFLEMKEAAITCLLSKRWQFLWTKLPGLRFKQDYINWDRLTGLRGSKQDNGREMEKINKFVNRVHKTLVIFSRRNLERFELNFIEGYKKCFASDVKVWIGFAVENKVKIFSLLLCCSHHVLPQMMYSNPCWTSLTLRGCTMYPRGTIQWQSLARLRIEFVVLNEDTFEKIFSGCPLLSSLDLSYCRGFNRLEVNSSSLCTLAIEIGVFGGELKISAPYIHTIKIISTTNYRVLHLENTQSPVKAELAVVPGPFKCFSSKHSKNNLKQLLGSTRHVKMLKLGRDCIELLSLIAPSWELPQSTREYLELHVMPDKKYIPGIVAILESSPNLETLVIHGDTYPCWVDVPSNTASKDGLDCDLFHLKTVCFKNFGKSNHDVGEPMLTIARTLLERAIVLEKMVVSFPGFNASSTTALYKMAQTLLSYPRSSQKAVVLFS